MPENVPNRPFSEYDPALIPRTIFEDEGMHWYILAQLYSTLIELLRVSRMLTDDKDLEILVLRQQLVVMVLKTIK